MELSAQVWKSCKACAQCTWRRQHEANKDDMKQTKTTWSKQRRHDDTQDMFILKGNYNCGEVNV